MTGSRGDGPSPRIWFFVVRCISTFTVDHRRQMADENSLVVAIPARDEADRIGDCLRALDQQVGARLDHIVLLLNNTVDDSETVARSVALNEATHLHVINRTLPLDQANAGHARRIAMDEAAKLAGPSGVILTTDADGEVTSDWLAANLAALRDGANVVAGWVALHPGEWAQIPKSLHEDDARECAYDALCDEIHALLDPDPWDPLPRHTQNSGASIAVTARAYALCGGVPAVASAEDRALVEALRRVDARIRHAPGVHVSVSGRVQGRAPGGMADTILRRMLRPDTFLDDRLEPAADCVRRARMRAQLRRAYDNPAADLRALADQLALPGDCLTDLLGQPFFGMAWAAVERRAPGLRRRLVPVAELGVQMAAAKLILARLREPDDRSDMPPLEPEELA